MTTRLRALAAPPRVWRAAAIIAALGCGRRDASVNSDSSGAGHVVAAASARPAGDAAPGRFAAIPADPCAWLSVAEVEEVMGRLAGPPGRAGDSCRYPVQPDSALLARKARLRDLARQIAGPDDPAIRDTSWDKAAVLVSVEPRFDPAAARGSAVADSMAAMMLARARANSASGDGWARAARPEGWDATSGAFSTFEGRLGHVRVMVGEDNMMRRLVAFETKVALAARVRDRIPDLPFANPNSGVSAHTPQGPDPCSLITRSEAEAVLGPLVVEPYRIGETEPLAEAGGRSCGYFTKNHHVLVVTPYWSDGKTELALMRGIGKLVAIAAPDPDAEAADTLEGPWDEAALDLDGSLAFLAGDRLLRISYATSSIDKVQAVRLARTAVGRVASTSGTTKRSG